MAVLWTLALDTIKSFPDLLWKQKQSRMQIVLCENMKRKYYSIFLQYKNLIKKILKKHTHTLKHLSSILNTELEVSV